MQTTIYKPCPFCSYPYVGKVKNGETLLGFTHIACAKCEAQVIGGDLEYAVKLWNTRPLEDKLINDVVDMLMDEAEKVKHNYHVDGVGMGWQALESRLIKISKEIECILKK